MNDNIVEVIPGIFGEIQPTGCIISTLSKNSRGYANKRLKIDGEWKTLTIHRLVLENSLGRPIRPEYFCCHSCDVRNCINPNHLWEGCRLENSQDRFRKGRIKDVGSTSAPQPKKELHRFPFVPGKICPSRKLKPEQVQQIRYLLSEGISKREIARTFAISRSQIILLGRGEIYRDIL
ncbi:MAG: helix-turn-helix domain-containing protein [Tychonema bourrellyi B0820]|uniref:Resolvase HTH domain-containing protein n=1 Tax=Tychonema bourrellyi FEM_GT703 TaxID=2040638 RepID=A0A2G4F2U1_9CYAN|nr:helix-turn-helix domain-containing protein [Tychonema bourrellyi]MDQ2096936.1 helix-turn-helix domain-containing protein [Tychonema bourrellyi B0820]PHX55777.1 hypothetical protein CP500_008995 [Tychonema bourrellyi FEM_GT703]